jgi:hypothetical protein
MRRLTRQIVAKAFRRRLKATVVFKTLQRVLETEVEQTRHQPDGWSKLNAIENLNLGCV